MLMWTKLLATDEYEAVESITQGSDGALYVTGVTYGNLGDTPRQYPDRAQLFVSKLNSDGVPIWTKTSELLKGFSVALDPQDSVFIASGVNSENYVTLRKLGSDGSFNWSQMLGYSYYIYVGSVITSNDGSAYLATLSTDDVDGWENQGEYDSFITKVSSTGEILWTHAISGRDNDEVSFLDEGPDGGIYVTGWTTGNLNGKANPTQVNAFIIKLNDEGKEEWTTLVGGRDDIRGKFVTLDSEGSAYVVSEPGSRYIWDGDPLKLTKLSPNGRPLWTKELLGSSGSGNNVLVTAGSEENEFFVIKGVEVNSDVRVQKFNLEGELLGSQTLTSTQNQYTNSVYVDSSFVYLAGYLYDSNGYQYDAFVSKFSLNLESGNSGEESPSQDGSSEGSSDPSPNDAWTSTSVDRRMTDVSDRNVVNANDEIAEYFRGDTGLNGISYDGSKSSYDVAKVADEVFIRPTGSSNIDLLVNVERMHFGDSSLAFDLDGSAGQAYRVYKAAFDRDPMQNDLGGLGFWISQIDNGMDMVEVAARFIDSAEFRSLYGQNPTNGEFLNKVYLNVLDRLPDAGGYSWWLDQLDNNPDKTWEKVLADFSESPENQTNVAELIGNGIQYEPWVS